MSEEIVRAEGKWKHSSQTSRKLWNNFIEDVGNIFNNVCCLCYLFCLFCKVTLNAIYQNKDLGL